MRLQAVGRARFLDSTFLEVAMMVVSDVEAGCDVAVETVAGPAIVAEVVRVVRAPRRAEVEALEVDLLDVSLATEAESLDRLHRHAMVEVSEVMSIDVDIVMSVMRLDDQVEVVVVVQRVVGANLASPRSVLARVDDNAVLATVTEAEVDVENHMRAREKLDREAVMVVVNASVDVDLRSVGHALVHRKNGRNANVVDGVHDCSVETEEL